MTETQQMTLLAPEEAGLIINLLDNLQVKTTDPGGEGLCRLSIAIKAKCEAVIRQAQPLALAATPQQSDPLNDPILELNGTEEAAQAAASA